MFFIKKILILFFIILASNLFGQGKIAPRLESRDFKFERSKNYSVNVKDSIHFIKQYLNKITRHYHHAQSNCFLISVRDRSILEELKKDPNVLFIDSPQKPVMEAEFEFNNLSFNRVNKVHRLFTEIKGAGQNISVKEENFDISNINLKNRGFTTAISPTIVSQHTTAMTTIIAGAGNSSPSALGVVPEARFTASNFNNLLPDNASIFSANHIHLQNHSYGVGIENYYGNEAYAYDKQVSENPFLLHIFSAGNSGSLKPTSGVYQNMEFANLTGNFKQAKNVLVVNAVDTTLLTNALNSRGPTYDGRLKPELTAFGQGGTSEAAALVSGISALIQNKYSMLDHRHPDAALVKAILIASADDLGTQGIDYRYGYGSVNAFNALQLIDLNQFAEATLTSQGATSLPITIPAGTASLKVAIAWIDPPASLNASSSLVHDIDASLSDGATTFYPWVLSSYPHPDSLHAKAKRKADHRNTVEYITLTNPTAGSYQLKLKAGALNSSQTVSIAYWLTSQKKFNWDFPIAGDIAIGNEKNLLVWEAQSDQVGDLSIQFNLGNWQLIKSGINLNQALYWRSPDTLAMAKLKMRIGIEDFISDDFLISPSLKIRNSYNCTDSIGLSWNGREEAMHYELFSMGDLYLEKIASPIDSLIGLTKSSDLYFAVAPVFNGVTGLKSETINYTQQGAFCYLNLFAAERSSATEVKVRLSLSSWHEVDHVTIFKTTANARTIFRNLPPTQFLNLTFLDSELVPGTMYYEAEIIFKNGKKIISDRKGVLIEEKGKLILYPNPVTSESDLTILSDGSGMKFQVIDLLGRVVLEKKLNAIDDAIDIIDLHPGMYLYRLVSKDEITDTGRFIKY